MKGQVVVRVVDGEVDLRIVLKPGQLAEGELCNWLL